MKSRSLILLFLGAMFSTGCMQELDRKQLQVRQDYGNAVKNFATASKVVVKEFDNMAEKKHQYQAADVERIWSDFLATHTDANGGLVSKAPDGKIVPMPVTQMLEAVKHREEAALALAKSKETSADFSQKFTDAIAKLEAVTDVLAQEEIDIQAAKESIAAAANSIFSAMISAGISLGVGAAL